MGVFRWFGFIGAWLLFAGPVYQAALELREQGFERAEMDALRARLDAIERPRLNPWWWLLPPVAYVISRRQDTAWQLASLKAMTQSQRERLLTFQNKAAGWLIVGLGALCIAVKETGELVEHYEWPVWALVALLVVPFLLAVGNTATRLERERRTREMTTQADPANPA